jgi:hypothetical protein
MDIYIILQGWYTKMDIEEAIMQFDLVINSHIILYNRTIAKVNDDIRKKSMKGEIKKLEELRSYIKERLKNEH